MFTHRQQRPRFLIALAAHRHQLQKTFAHARQLRQSSCIVLIGLVALGRYEPVRLKCFKNSDWHAQLGEARIKPAAHVAGFKADLHNIGMLDTIAKPPVNIAGSGQRTTFGYRFTLIIDDANLCLLL
jgi:hypothetical protein